VKAEIKRLSEKLKKMDAQRHSGAPDRLPKSRMLDASALAEKDPEHHYLYVNVDEPGNLQVHADDGYTAVPEEECRQAGVRQRVGELVLMRIPRQEYERRIEQQRRVAKSRLDSFRQDYRERVEEVVYELRRRGYSDHELSRILVDE